MRGMTLIDQATARREAARQRTGQFGEQHHTAPELTLARMSPTLERLGEERAVILAALATLDGDAAELDETALDSLLTTYFEDRPQLVRAADIRTIRDHTRDGFVEHDRARAALQEARALPAGPARDAALADDGQVMKDFYAAGRQLLANYEQRSRAGRVLNALTFNNGIERKREAMALRDTEEAAG